MVTTRRSRSGQAGEQHSGDAGPAGSQPEVASAATPNSKHPAAAAAADHGLQVIAEEPADAQAAAAEGAQQHSQQLPEQPLPLTHAKRQRRQQPQSPQAPAVPAAATHSPGAAGSPADYGGTGDSNNDDGDDDEDADSDCDYDGPNMLQNLAASIRSAMSSRAGQNQQQQQQGKRSKRKPPGHEAAAAAGDSDDMDVERLRWQPHTGLQLPAAAVQVVAAAAGARQAAGNDAAVATAGPLVDTPANAASQPAAATAVPRSLAKHSRAPSLDPVEAAREARKAAPKTAGKQWYGLPATKISDDVKRDLRLLRLRGAYDPKRFYKSFDDTKFPKHFAIGTVVDDPLDFYGGRLSAGQRKASLTEQLLADRELEGSRKKRYNKLQEEAQKWVKHKKRKTDLPRKTPSKHRPKH